MFDAARTDGAGGVRMFTSIMLPLPLPVIGFNGWFGQGWTYGVVMGMLMDKYFDGWNQFDADGKPGKATQLASKSVAKAVLTGELEPNRTPEVAEGLRMITAMFEDTPARFGAETGGTSYLIPSTTTGQKLDAAVKFLQFASSTPGNQAWLDKSGGIPATRDGKARPGLQGLMIGEWFNTSLRVTGLDLRPKALAGKPLYDGYLLGTKNEEVTLKTLKENWIAVARESAKDAGWTESRAESK